MATNIHNEQAKSTKAFIIPLIDKAAQFARPLFKPVYKKTEEIAIINVASHRLVKIPFTGSWEFAHGVVCSRCRGFIWVTVHKCEYCKLMTHEKCIKSLQAQCIASDDGSGPKNQPHHQFKPERFWTPTYCHHCGLLLRGVGIEPQGLECKACKMAVHYDCQKLVCYDCGFRDQSKNDRNIAAEYNHNSKLNIHDFEFLGLLSHGSFGKVYSAKLKDDESGNRFAIKVIKKTNIALNGDPESVLTEKKTLGLGRNYHFLTIAHCCFQSRERLFFVMEHVNGVNMFSHLNKCRKFTEYQTKFYGSEIVLALIYLHNHDIIYRDLKLDNIILDSTGHCRLVDYGMSKELVSSNRAKTFCGTPGYMAPEIIRNQDYDYSVDWWSMGVLLYEMLVGSSPFFDAQNEEQLYEMILKEPIHFPKMLSYRARSLLEEFLERNPQQRLGCQIVDGCSEAIKEHPFFLFETPTFGEGFQWDAIEEKRIRPPYVPTIQEIGAEQQIETRSSTMSPVDDEQLKRISQDDYDGFSFYSDSFKSLADIEI